MINQALQDLTQTLREELRGRDLVGRWDNYQLAVMLPATPGSAAKNTFRRIQKILSGSIEFDGSIDMVIKSDPCIGISSTEYQLSGDELINETIRAAQKASAIKGDTIILVEQKQSMNY